MQGVIVALLVAWTLLLSACSVEPAMRCTGAERSTLAGRDSLRLQLRVEWPAAVMEALDASIPLRFVVQLERRTGIADQHDIELRFDPLLERYELQHGEQRQSYRLRAEMLEAFANTLQFAEASEITRLRLWLDRTALPAPMRMPTLMDHRWRLDSGWCALDFAVANS
jgi:hypothetical protein